MSSWSSSTYPLLLWAVLSTQLCLAGSVERTPLQQEEMNVAMRMIGHQVLLAVGDTSSLVLPVEKVNDQYKIRFGAEFELDPDVMTTTIDSLMSAKNISEHYVVEFVKCGTDTVVHGYGITPWQEDDIMACRGRTQPVGCYELLISILDLNRTTEAEVGIPAGEEKDDRALLPWLLLVFPIAGVVAVLLKRRSTPTDDPHVVQLGKFQFNKRNMELSFGKERIRLTSKEADLLQLLSASANNTVERDDILASVWGDEGDYVGRTLDVFISKLRKKLEADANVRIVNIRGVGYKLVLGS